jgi:hypothetical protein
VDVSVPIDPVVYPLLICLSSAVAALALIGVAIAAMVMSVRRRHRTAMQSWAVRGYRFVLPPMRASFLNEPRSLGVGSKGTLALTQDALHFAQVMPEREITIPLRDVASVHLVDKFNGRSGGGPYLVIRRNVGDVSGFQIGDARRMAEAINSARAGNLPLARAGELHGRAVNVVR